MKRETKTIELKIRVWGWLIVLKRGNWRGLYFWTSSLICVEFIQALLADESRHVSQALMNLKLTLVPVSFQHLKQVDFFFFSNRYCFLKCFFIWKYIKIIYFYFLKFIFDINISKRSNNTQKIILSCEIKYLNLYL
jgi:hypothetical protein